MLFNSAQHFDEKAKSNKATHRVDFQEAPRVFADPLARICEDEKHSGEEPREIIIGHSASVRPRVIFVCFTGRDRRIRVIGARQATPLSVKTMKKTSRRKKRRTASNAMRNEYWFDYRRAKRNRFAEKMTEGGLAVVLEPDVAAVFRSSEAVNTLLRSVIAAMR